MIYFITARDIGRVKIGHSAKPAQRFSKMQSDSPVALALERVCAGGESDEARLHLLFSEHRISGEWFSLSPEIEAHMETLGGPAKVPRKSTNCTRQDPLTAIRRTLGLSQADMAYRLGLHQTTISRFERGDLPLDKRTLLAAQLLLSQAQRGEAA